MKQYRTKDGYMIRKIGRSKKIYFNGNGEPYFLWNGNRQKFDNIPNLSYPVMYEDENGKLGVIGGYITISNVFGVLVELDDSSESVQLWEEIR